MNCRICGDEATSDKEGVAVCREHYDTITPEQIAEHQGEKNWWVILYRPDGYHGWGTFEVYMPLRTDEKPSGLVLFMLATNTANPVKISAEVVCGPVHHDTAIAYCQYDEFRFSYDFWKDRRGQ